MNNNIKDNGDRKKILAVIVMIGFLMFCTTGATYAYFAVNATNSSATGNAASVGLTLSVTRVTPDDTKYNASTKVMVPQLDAGLGTAMSTTNKCVDGNNNIVCQVYKIDIANTGSASVKLRGSVYFTYSSTFTNLYWRQVTGANSLGSNTVYKASTAKATNSTTANTENATLINNLSLVGTGITGTKTATYYVVVWIREINNSQNTLDTGTWTMSVDFDDAVNGNGVTSTITS